jgi:outer membrane immunogenic protein
MRRGVSAALGTTALGFATMASAADIGPGHRAAPAAPTAVPYSWTGCYLGGHVGGGWNDTRWVNRVNTTLWGDFPPGQSIDTDASGVAGGGQFGCNYQFNALVVGVEGTYSAADIDGTRRSVIGAGDDVFHSEIASIFTVTGRLGLAWDRWMIYGKGGYAATRARVAISDAVGPNVGSGSIARWHDGWTAGVGIEYAFTPSLIFGIAYDFIDVGSKRYEFAGGAAGSYQFDVDPRYVHLITARLSWKFGWPAAPVAARF